MAARRFHLLLVVMVLSLAALACNLPGLGGEPAGQSAETGPGIDAPVVEIRVPTNGMSFAEGTLVIIQVAATDAGAGVSRVDLLVDDLPVGSQNAPNAAGQSAFIANFEWQALGQGLHSVSAVAFRADGTASSPAVISVNVVAAPPTQVQPTATPQQPTAAPEQTEEPTPEPAQPTEPPPTPTSSSPRGVTTTGMNVRNGPSTLYPIIGSLLAGTDLELVGRNADSSWFVVPYGLSQGWVFGGLLTVTGEVSSLPVISAPPPPPTATPIPPTAAATQPPAGPSISFTSTVGEGQTYPSGTCFTFWWSVSGVSAVYFQGEGVPGEGSREVCPTTTTTYTLHVVLTDGSAEDRQITANIQ